MVCLMCRLFVVSIFLIVGSAFAGVIDHLKKIDSKPSGHSIPGIDYIYVINLDQRPEKFKMTIDQLEPYGIHPYRFSAVNGWELSLDTINDVGVKYAPGMRGNFMATTYSPLLEEVPHDELISQYGRTYFCHCLSRGAIGIILSHLSVLKDAYESGYDTIWVMEDDIDVIQNPWDILDRVEELDSTLGKENWDILFTDRDIRDHEGKYVPASGYPMRPNYHPSNFRELCKNYCITKNIRRVGARFGATSMIVRRSGMKKILDFYSKYDAYFPYDIDFHVPPGIKLFTVTQDIVSNKIDALSDNGCPFYKDKTN